MVLCNIECIERVAQYLDVFPGKLEISDKNVSTLRDLETRIHYFGAITLHMCKTINGINGLFTDKDISNTKSHWIKKIINANFYL